MGSNLIWLIYFLKGDIQAERQTCTEGRQRSDAREGGHLRTGLEQCICKHVQCVRGDQRLRAAWNRPFPNHFRGSLALPTPQFQTSGCQSCETTLSCCFQPLDSLYFGTQIQQLLQKQSGAALCQSLMGGRRSITQPSCCSQFGKLGDVGFTPFLRVLRVELSSSHLESKQLDNSLLPIPLLHFLPMFPGSTK